MYPLEGAAAPTLLDRLVPRTSRAHLLRGRRWWLRNAGDVERFRDPTRDRRPPGRSAPPPPRRPPPTKRRESAPRTPAGPRAVLDVAADASLADVRRAWRAAVKRWHPDRIPTRDPVVVEEAHRRFAELRAAYEALVAELSR